MIKKTLGLLTVLLGFVGVSFGATYELNQPSSLNNLGLDAIFTFTNGVNFNINSQYFNYMVAGGDNAKYNLFWSNTGLYFVYSYNWGTTDLIQGYIKKFCRTTYNNVCNGSTVGVQWIDISEFINNSLYTNANYFNDYVHNTSSFAFCFGYESLNESICFLVDPYLKNEFSTFGGSLGITRNPNLADLSNDSIKNYFTVSPFSNSNNTPVVPDYSIGTGGKIRNYEVLMGFEYMGLSQQLCYGGFGLDNLYLESEKFSEWTGYNFGGGASIFQLHNAYSGGSTLKPFLSSYYQSYLNGQVSNFYNKSKGLFMFYQQYYSSSNLDSHSFNLGDLRDYCYLLFYLVDNNWENDGDEYTGNNQHAIDSYNQNKKTNDGGFTNTGVLGTGNFTGFESADAFFGRLTNLFQSNVNGVNGDFSPMIPSYIVVFMLAFILIRIISH